MPKRRRDQNGRTPLARACAAQEFEAAKAYYAEVPGDLNIADNAGNTPLQIASLEGCADIVEFLIQCGSEVETKNIDKDTPLIDAVENGHLDVVRLLLDAGANPRVGNAQGDEPYDLVPSDSENYEEIRRVIAAAKAKSRRRKSVDEKSSSGGSASANSGTVNESHGSSAKSGGKGSPPPATTSGSGSNSNTTNSSSNSSKRRGRSPLGIANGALSGTSRRRTVRSETTRNDLLWTKPTLENLRDFAAKGDMEGAATILNVLQKADTECLIAAAKGGHDEVLGLLLGMGEPDPDPEPVPTHKEGYNTPMLAAIGRGNDKVIKLLLKQEGFDPTRRLYMGMSYYDIAKQRKGDQWQAEYNTLKKAYDEYVPPSETGQGKRGGRSPVKRNAKEKERRTRRSAAAAAAAAAVAAIEEESDNDRETGRNTRRAKERGSAARRSAIPDDSDVEMSDAPDTVEEESRSRPRNQHGRKRSGRERETRDRRDSSSEEPPVIRRRRLYPGRPPPGHSSRQQEQHDQDDDMEMEESDEDVAVQPNTSSRAGRREKGSASRRDRSPTPSDAEASAEERIDRLEKEDRRKRRNESQAPPTTKKRKVGGELQKEQSNSASLASSTSLNTVPPSSPSNKKREPSLNAKGDVKSQTTSSTDSSEPLMNSRGSSINDRCSPPKRAIEKSKEKRGKTTNKTNDSSDKSNSSGAKTTSTYDSLFHDSETHPDAQKDHEEGERVKAEQNKMDIDFEDIPPEAEKAHDESDIDMQHDGEDQDDEVARAAAEKFAEEKRTAFKRALELRKAADEAEEAAQRYSQLTQERLREENRRRREYEQQRRAAKEEDERRRKADRERARVAAIRREKEENERKRREKLPNMLRVAAEYISNNDPRAKDHSFLRHFNPIFYVTTRMLEPGYTDVGADESWIPNFLVAPLLGTNDLRLSNYMSWEKRDATSTQRQCLWRVSRRCMIKEGDVNPVTLTAESVFAKVEPTRDLFLGMEHIFWVRLADFKDIVPHIPHLQGLRLKYVKMHLDSEPEAKITSSSSPSSSSAAAAGTSSNGSTAPATAGTGLQTMALPAVH